LKIGEIQANQNLIKGEVNKSFSDTVYWSSKSDKLWSDFSSRSTFKPHKSSTISIPSSKDTFALLKALFVLLSPKASPVKIEW